MTIEILHYQAKLKEAFERLSYEWLYKYDLYEPEDEKIIQNPKEVVIDNGGVILFAKYKGEMVGTVSLIIVDKETAELAKLAVTEKYQGLQIGTKLVESCLEIARHKEIKRVILYSNHQLKPALKIYEKFNFQHATLGESKYVESDVEMELFID